MSSHLPPPFHKHLKGKSILSTSFPSPDAGFLIILNLNKSRDWKLSAEDELRHRNRRAKAGWCKRITRLEENIYVGW